ncbi:CoA pyrophosphatase [Fusobacterium sp.]|uniref:NUDIX hydrolase n=1 Tax=Fusobacterium sp. TaxID=68766 RepID=UPI0025BD8082|nr:CoA pyrophosphatase [Fusobacterium sp.]
MKNKILKLLSNTKNVIIGEEKYIIAAVLITMIVIEDEEYIVLEKRASQIRQGGEISFPGGKYDTSDLTTETTAYRETYEELGVEKEKIEILGKFGSLITPRGMLLDIYVGYLNIEDVREIRFNVSEVEKLLFVPIKFFKENKPRIEKIETKSIPMFSPSELRLPRRYGNSWSGYFRDVYFYNYQEEVIWGITAEIIYEFIQKYS